MSAGTRSDGDQPVHPRLSGFLRMAASRHIMEYQAAVAVDRIDHFLHGAETGDHDRHFVFDTDVQIRLQSRITVVHNQVHRIGRGILQCRQPGLDFFQPGFEAAALALVQRRKAADHAIAAAGEHQLRVGNQEHRRRHHGQTQALFEQSGQRHWNTPVICAC
ncbi:hypothetical protein D3C76_1285970 [compost metagenome]